MYGKVAKSLCAPLLSASFFLQATFSVRQLLPPDNFKHNVMNIMFKMLCSDFHSPSSMLATETGVSFQYSKPFPMVWVLIKHEQDGNLIRTVIFEMNIGQGSRSLVHRKQARKDCWMVSHNMDLHCIQDKLV